MSITLDNYNPSIPVTTLSLKTAKKLCKKLGIKYRMNNQKMELGVATIVNWRRVWYWKPCPNTYEQFIIAISHMREYY